MKSKTKKKITLFAVISIMVLFIAGCDWFISVLTQPYGKVIDAKTGLGVEAVTVTLTFDESVASTEDKENVSASGVYTAITTTSGSFSWVNEIDNVPYGTYTVSATKAGYVFFSKVVTIGGLSPNLGTILGLSSTVSATDISFILLWNDNFDDCDAYLTYPKTGAYTTDGTAPIFSDPYSAPVSNAYTWFSPDTFTGTAGPTADRMKIYYNNPSTASDSDASWDSTNYVNTLIKGTKDFDSNDDSTNDSYKIELDVDATLGGGPESITVRTFPWNDQVETPNTSPTAANALPTGAMYAWVGVMEYYADSFENEYGDSTSTNNYLSTNSGTSSTSADAVLYVLQGTTVLGKYTIPDYTQIKTASLVRVNCFWNDQDGGTQIYQIVPDLRILQTTDGIRSVYNSNGIITVTGQSR